MSGKRAKKEAIIINAHTLSEHADKEKVPQDFFNSQLHKHDEYTRQIIGELAFIVRRQKEAASSYVYKSGRYKSIPLLKRILLRARALYDLTFRKDPKMQDELRALKKQVQATRQMLTKNQEQDSEHLITFLKIPYKPQYEAKDIDHLLSIIQDKHATKNETLRALSLYRKRLTFAIKHHHEARRLSDPRHTYFWLNKDYDPSAILENEELHQVLADNEEITYRLFKLLKINAEFSLFASRQVCEHAYSNVYLDFAGDVNNKLETAYRDIGKSLKKKFSDEDKEEKEMRKDEKRIEEAKKELRDSTDVSIEKGNKDIEDALLDATPKGQKQ